jgi:hypothetical protein
VVIRAPGHHPPRPGTIGYNDRDAALALRPNWPRLCIHQAFHTSNRIVRSARPSMARTDGRGFVRRVVDQAILCLSVLLVESAEVLTTHQPTCRLAEHDRTGTARWFPRSLQTGRQVRRPAVPLRYRRRYAALPAPRRSPSSGAVPVLVRRGRCGGPNHVESRPQLPGELRSRGLSCDARNARAKRWVARVAHCRRCLQDQPGSPQGIKELGLPVSGILAGKVRVDEADRGGTFAHRCCHPFD